MLRGLVLGGGLCVWKDAEAALALFEPDAVIAINDMIPRWPGPIDYACSLHDDKIARWKASRPGNKLYQVWSRKRSKGIDRVTNDWGGSSGLYACKILMQEGFDRIVLAGVPMVPAEKNVARNQVWNAAKSYRKAWERHAEIKQFVRSISGWTKDLLGYPTPEWLGVEAPARLVA